MAATLPRFAPTGGKNYPGPRPTIVLPRPSSRVVSTTNFSNKGPNDFMNSFNENDANITQDSQLQLTRQTAQQRYENYMAKIRQLERSIIMTKKRVEQNTNKNTKRTVDSISSLYSEILQMNNQQTLLKRKISNVKRTLLSNTRIGLERSMKPLKQSFRQFHNDIDESLPNITKLINNLEERINIINKHFIKMKDIPQQVDKIQPRTEEVKIFHINNLNRLADLKNELNEEINNEHHALLKSYKFRLASLQSRIDSLMKKAAVMFDQAQTAVSHVETGNFEMRSKFNQQMESSMSSFRGKLLEAKQRVSLLNDTRLSYIEEVAKRLRDGKEMISKIEKKKMKNAIEEGKINMLSMKQEVATLKAKVDDMEELLIERTRKKRSKPKKPPRQVFKKKEKKKKKRKNIVEVYHAVDKQGKVSIIFVIDDVVISK